MAANKNNYKLFILSVLAVINILAFIAFGASTFNRPASMIFFDVGQGDGTLIMAENNNQILIDGGDGVKIMEKLGKYVPFYDRLIEMVIITHPDSDHAGGLIEVLNNYNVKEVISNKYICDTQICRELDNVILNKKIKRSYAKSGELIYAGRLIVRVIYAGNEKSKNDNNNSIVLKADINGKSVLLMGDAGTEVEKDLIDKGIDLKSDILKVSHHGSKSATSAAFLEKVKPNKAIISVGKNKYGHPSSVVTGRLHNLSVETLRTDEIGDIVIE